MSKKFKEVAKIVSGKNVVKKMIIDAYENSGKTEYDLNMFKDFELLGEGGFGKVYKAYDNKTDKTIVIKVISKARVSSVDIEQELKVLEHLKPYCDQYILCFEDWFQDYDNWYIITEFLHEYITLADLKLYGKIKDPLNVTDINRLLGIINNMYLGLKEIHVHNVSHRDVKPENILVDKEGTSIKYIDFGFACINNVCADNNKIKGSPIFIAPDYLLIALNKGNPKSVDTQKLDIWALACTIYELIIGETPYQIWFKRQIRRGRRFESAMDSLTKYQMYWQYFYKKNATFRFDKKVEEFLGKINMSLKNMFIKDPNLRSLNMDKQTLKNVASKCPIRQ